MSERSRLQQENLDRFLTTSHCTVDESKNFVGEIYSVKHSKQHCHTTLSTLDHGCSFVAISS